MSFHDDSNYKLFTINNYEFKFLFFSCYLIKNYNLFTINQISSNLARSCTIGCCNIKSRNFSKMADFRIKSGPENMDFHEI